MVESGNGSCFHVALLRGLLCLQIGRCCLCCVRRCSCCSCIVFHCTALRSSRLLPWHCRYLQHSSRSCDVNNRAGRHSWADTAVCDFSWTVQVLLTTFDGRLTWPCGPFRSLGCQLPLGRWMWAFWRREVRMTAPGWWGTTATWPSWLRERWCAGRH